ncbi:CHASE domain-containing protein [Methyloversatilis discipulorum]|uniref:CHASE domain-containing protein n=1 Tax=Methyloversatilis discipulorum TaxID=1119528 RepID=UPI001A47A627|nr:CHASE domain-containing protein [Methyloversatilis discipulorum]MBL8468462.1 CHASE domain-containing protein [Methyloversatilis discipulorum]
MSVTRKRLTPKTLTAAALALLLAILVAAGVGEGIRHRNEAEKQQRFEALAQRAVRQIEERISRYEYGLRGARGAIVAVGPDQIRRTHFRSYSQTRDLPNEFPGASGFGFIRRVPVSQEGAFIERVRTDGKPDFAIRALVPHDGERFVIEFIEPESTNAPAIGLDIASEPHRRSAAVQAMRENSATLTRPITLVQRSGVKQGGLLFLLPVYASGTEPHAESDRMNEGVGWAYAPLAIDDVLRAFDYRDGEFTLAIFDVSDPASPQQAFASAGHGAQAADGLLRAHPLPIYGREWRVEIKAQPKFLADLNQASPVHVGFAVFISEVFLGLMVGGYVAYRRRISESHVEHSRLAAIVESSNDAIIGKRLDGTVFSWNRAAEEMFGYTREEALGRTIAELLIPADLIHEEAMILYRLRQNERVSAFDTRRRCKDGRLIDVSVTISPIRDENGEIVGGSKTVRDITQQKAVEAKIRQMNASLESQVAQRTEELKHALTVAQQAAQAKADFLANMSHEIRTPMNGVLGLTSLLQKRKLPDDAAELVAKIRGAGHTLMRIINDVLDFSKIEEGRLDLESIPFSLVEVFDDVATIMATTVGDKRIELVIMPPPDGVDELKGDALRLEQILNNLVSNAIKFTSRGHVMLSCRLMGQSDGKVIIRFTVQDTGTGIPLEKQSSIFDPFTQADTSTTRRFGGTGLGLAICRQLVALMGGEMGLNSVPGHGSEFWFSVPFGEMYPSIEKAASESALEVLVVDDNDVALDALRTTVAHLGWVPRTLSSGTEALDLLLDEQSESRAPDVLVIDWDMPDKNGLEVVRDMRKNLPEEDTPVVIMVTAHRRDALESEPDAELTDVILTKPVTSSALYDAVLAAMRRRGADLPFEAASGSNEDRLAGLRVFVVDDSDINRELAMRIFGAEGAEITLATNGREAVDLVGQSPGRFDIVLMDVQMPEMDGLEATRLIRAFPHGNHLPIIALTAGAFDTQREVALASGMNAVVTKPFDVDLTVRLIRQLCGAQPQMRPGPDIDPHPVRQEERPVLNAARGLQIWGDAPTYHTYLRKFAAAYSGCEVKLVTLPADDALRLAHKLKGAAASLGIDRLADAAGAFEELLRQNPGAERPIEGIRTALRAALAAVSDYAKDAVPTDAGPGPAKDADVAMLFRRLLKVLDADNPDGAMPVLSELDGHVPIEALERLRERIGSFDFRAAEAELRRTAVSIGVDISMGE